MFKIISASPEQTRELGAAIGAELTPGDVVMLEGDLGAGKTTLVQGLAAGWGSRDQVTSPTFVLINDYGRPGETTHLYHMDAYRLSGAAEAEDLDLDAYLAKGPLVVEWAERIREALPDEFLHLFLAWIGEDETRQIVITAQGARYEKLMTQIQNRLNE